MSTLVNVPKNGNLVSNNSGLTLPSWSRWIDEMFHTDFPSVFTSNFNSGMSLPKVNIKETTDAYVVEMAIPGLQKSDFNIDLDNHVLSISSETEKNETQKEENYTRREFGYASFKRSFTLPETVDDSKIDATYKEGILHITLPKKEEAKRKPARAIKIS